MGWVSSYTGLLLTSSQLLPISSEWIYSEVHFGGFVLSPLIEHEYLSEVALSNKDTWNRSHLLMYMGIFCFLTKLYDAESIWKIFELPNKFHKKRARLDMGILVLIIFCCQTG